MLAVHADLADRCEPCKRPCFSLLLLLLLSTRSFQKKIDDLMKPVEVDPNDKSMGAYWKRFRNAALSGMAHDIHDDIKDDEQLQDMHADAERFDPRTEEVFKVLQVISACAMAFAHGANDVANAIGPFAAALYVYNNFQVPSNNSDVSACEVQGVRLGLT
jgi:phosphate/sulfate permease